MNKQTKLLLITGIIIISLVIISVGTCAYLYTEGKNTYKNADIKQQEAEDMARLVITPAAEAGMPDKEDVMGGSNLYPRIDFSKLADIEQSEIYGWLYIPDTDIDYIIMQGNKIDPYKYLWKDPKGEKSKTGSLFVRYGISEEEATNIIYGHRLKDHSIYFGQLLTFKDEDYAKEHDKCYIYKPDSEESYELYAVVNGTETDIVYCYPYFNNTEEYEYLLSDIKNKASFTFDRAIDQSSKILVLSTCSGKRAGDTERLYLVYQTERKTPSFSYGDISDKSQYVKD